MSHNNDLRLEKYNFEPRAMVKQRGRCVVTVLRHSLVSLTRGQILNYAYSHAVGNDRAHARLTSHDSL